MLERRPISASRCLLLVMVLLCGCRRESEVTVLRLAEHPELIRRAGEAPFVDLGTVTGRTLLRSGWSFDERWADSSTSFVWSLGPESVLRLPLAVPRDLEMRFRCRPLEPPSVQGQSIEIRVNGYSAAVQELGAGFATYSVILPAQTLRAGDNEIELSYAYHHPPRGGIDDSRELGVAWDWARFVEVPDGDRIRWSPGAQLEIHVDLPADSRLRWDGVRVDGSVRPSTEIEVAVRWRSGSDEKQLDRRIAATDGPETVALTPAEGPAILTLRAVPEDDHDTLERFLIAPRLVAPPAPPTSRPARVEAISPTPSNVVIYLIDTLRADRLGAYGNRRGLTPNLDRLAADGIVFENAYANSSWTKASVASLLTGANPWIHGAIGRSDAIDSEIFLVQEILRRNGYQTMGVSTNANVSADFGFDRGFQHWYRLYLAARMGEFMPASEVTRTFSEWLDVGDPRPFFAYLHTTDPHGPYRPSPEFRQRFAPGPYSTPLDNSATEEIDAYLAAHPEVSRAEVRRQLEELYDAEVAQNDAAFGALLRLLEAAGLYESTLIIATADHGEEFFDHGAWGHGNTLYRELLQVPLILKLPGRDRAGERVADVVRLLDVFPTVLGAAGLDPPLRTESLNLLDAFNGTSRPVISYLWLDGPEMISLIDHGHHWLACNLPQVGRPVELFDLALDPRERRNRVSAEPFLADFLGRQVDIQEAAAAELVEDRRVPSLSGAMRDQLRALGYLP